jgi:uncharacterized protein
VDGSNLRNRLRASLTDAMKARDVTAVAALRATIAAIDNAEAVVADLAPRADGGPIAYAVTGLGAGDVARRTLSDGEVAAIVRAEIEDRRAAARDYEVLGRSDRAADLRTQAAMLAAELG